MFYVEKENKIRLADSDRTRLENTFQFRPDLKGCEIKETDSEHTIVDFKIVTIEEAKEIERQRKLARKGLYRLTKADFWIACLELGITKAAVKERLALIPDATLRAKTEIRIDDAEFFYRGDEGLIALAKMFDITDEQLDVIFKVK